MFENRPMMRPRQLWSCLAFLALQGCATQRDPAGEAVTRHSVSDAAIAELPANVSLAEIERRFGPAEGQPGPRVTYRARDHKNQFFWIYYRVPLADGASTPAEKLMIDRILRADRIEEGEQVVWPPHLAGSR
jgi:hypothetical protein